MPCRRRMSGVLMLPSPFRAQLSSSSVNGSPEKSADLRVGDIALGP
eukprot:COSAG06_NODE_3651_length_5068_cov_9.582210_4_plen_46_part_00